MKTCPILKSTHCIISCPKWLNIGPGLGDREAPMIAALAKERPGVSIELFEIYESNPHACNAIRENIEKSKKKQVGCVSNNSNSNNRNMKLDIHILRKYVSKGI